MELVFSKRSLRIVGTLTATIIGLLLVGRFAYPGHNDLFNVWQSIVATSFVCYIIGGIMRDWVDEALRK